MKLRKSADKQKERRVEVDKHIDKLIRKEKEKEKRKKNVVWYEKELKSGWTANPMCFFFQTSKLRKLELENPLKQRQK